MRNQYGADLRKLVASRFAVEHVWTMHDVDAFEARVSAYPAIIVLSNSVQGGVTVAETTAEFGPASAFALAKASAHERFDDYTDVGVKHTGSRNGFPAMGCGPPDRLRGSR